MTIRSNQTGRNSNPEKGQNSASTDHHQPEVVGSVARQVDHSRCVKVHQDGMFTALLEILVCRSHQGFTAQQSTAGAGKLEHWLIELCRILIFTALAR